MLNDLCKMAYLPFMLNPEKGSEKTDGSSETRKAFLEQISREDSSTRT